MDNKYIYIHKLIINGLNSTLSILNKTKAHAKEHNISDADFLDYRLAPDMFNFAKQIQIVSDNAKTAAGKLASAEIPSMPDTEQSFDELIARIEKTLEYVNTFNADSYTDADNVKITFGWMPGKYITAADYTEKFLLSNFYFHIATAYDIARSKGVILGKMDYLAADLGFKDLA